MKRFIGSLFAVGCVAALCMGLVGCGSSGSSSSSTAASSGASAAASASATAVPADKLVDPATIDPYMLSGNESAPDVWYLDGNTSAEGIYFTKSDNEAGLDFTRVDAAGQDGDKEFQLVITDEKHLRTAMSSAPKIDIVFYDTMNCYDNVAGKSYKRVSK